MAPGQLLGTNTAQTEQELAYIKLNSQTPSPPRGAIAADFGTLPVRREHPENLRLLRLRATGLISDAGLRMMRPLRASVLLLLYFAFGLAPLAWLHDANGRITNQVTSRTRLDSAVEALSLNFQYDALGRVTNSILPDGSSTQTIYNDLGKTAFTIDQLGRTTAFQYDTLGRLTNTISPDLTTTTVEYGAEGQQTNVVNQLQQFTRYQHDKLGRQVRTEFNDGTTTTNYFDAAGQLTNSTDARGFSTFYRYDDVGRTIAVTNALGEVTRSGYDAAGNLTNSVDALNRTNRFVYDALNRRTAAIFPDDSFQQTFYDELGRRIAETDQATNTTWFGYDPLGRLTSVTNMLGHVTRYEYNKVGQQLRQIDARTNITSFDYDKLGRRILRMLPQGQRETNQYDVAGLLTNRIDFNTNATRFEYDAMNRLTNKVPASGPTVSYAYNALGLRTNMTDAAGSTIYTYDGRNRLDTKTRSWDGLSFSATLTYRYDENGNATNVVSSDTNGTSLVYHYDELNRLDYVDSAPGRTTYVYDDVGSLQSYTHPNNVNSFYEYDSLNRLTNLTSAKLLTEIARYTYQVNVSGHRTNAAERLYSSSLNSYPSTINRSYTYDSIYQLRSEEITGLSTSPATLTYNYDEVGNRLARTSNIPSIVTRTNAFNANDWLNTDTYDDNGNTTTALIGGSSVSDAYDFENRLTNRNSGIVTIEYDGDGNRVSKTVGGVTTLYVVDEVNPTGYAQVLEEFTVSTNTSALKRVITYGHAILNQKYFTGTQWSTNFYGADGHGSVRYLTDTLGQVTDTYDYDAFGNLVDRNGTTDNNYLFTGAQYDTDLGLYYLRARYQNADSGRFWVKDSVEGIVGDPKTLHKYVYCSNDPISRVDPSGNINISEISIVNTLRPMVSSMAKGLSASLSRFYSIEQVALRAALGTAISLYINVRARQILEPMADELVLLSNTLLKLQHPLAPQASQKVMDLAVSTAELQEKLAFRGVFRPVLAQIPLYGVVMGIHAGLDLLELRDQARKGRKAIVDSLALAGVELAVDLDPWSIAWHFATGLMDPGGDIRTTREIIEAVVAKDARTASLKSIELADRLSIYGRIKVSRMAQPSQTL